MEKQRLSPESWITAGLKHLETRGPASLGAETLARSIGTTKGSFYWHFKDLKDFHAQLSAEWKRQAATRLVAALEHQGPVAERLQKIGTPCPGEPEMRAWARENAATAKSVDEIDRLRLDAVMALLNEFGISNPDVARALYAAGVGLALLPDPGGDNARAMDTLVDLVLALR